MKFNDAITYPLTGKNAPHLGPFAVMVSGKDDLGLLCGLMNLGEDKARNLLMSKIYIGNGSSKRFALAGPLIGSPYAVILLEHLISWGARQFIFFGWCGAVSHDVKIGDVIVPTSAVIDEGTSKHYKDRSAHSTELNNVQQANRGDLVECVDQTPDGLWVSCPSESIVKKTKAALSIKGIGFREGPVWTTDAIYRETRKKVEYFQKNHVLAVEMETSALFTVGEFRHVEVGAILVVSDELSTFKWRPGFREKRFIKSRKAVVEVISCLCKNM